MPPSPHHLRRSGALLALLLAGCQGGSGADTDQKGSGIRPPRYAESVESAPAMDFGENWEDVEGLLSKESSQPPSGNGPQPSNVTPSIHVAPRFGICLVTFTTHDHVLGAREYVRRIGLLLPAMQEDLSLHIESDNTKVLYGDFTGWQDPEVGKVSRQLRGIRIQGRPVFTNPILTEVVPPRDPSTIGPLELLSVRLANPEVRTLYTLEVAVWGDFGGGELSDTQRRRLAENYTRSLRQGGHQAWYHHNERKKMSTVTVGVFDHRAIDSGSGIRSPMVERVMTHFPARLVNGEPLMVPVSPSDPGAGTRVQKPMIVEVPAL